MTALLSEPAPAFDAMDHEGNRQRLADLRGQWVLLYFYPKDDTPGCTTEACGFRDAYGELKEVVTILGVSGDSEASHQKFAAKYSLPFPLLVDPDRMIITAHGADGTTYPKRTSFLIDPLGIIRKIYEKIDCAAHAKEILQDVRELSKS